jgi:outer membrane protein
MFKKIMIAGSVILALSMFHASSVFAESTRMAFVKIAVVLDKAPQAKAANKRLAREFAPRNRALIELRKKLRGYEDRLAKQNVTMSESQIKRLERDIRDTKRRIRRAQEDYREDLNIRRNEELRKLQKRVYKAIITVANREKYDVVMGEGVIYASKRVDITQKILNELQAAYKVNQSPARNKK